MKLPEPIERAFETHEGYLIQRTDRDLLDELIERYNELIAFLREPHNE